MEEKVLIKGVFGGKFISIILYILAIIFAVFFIALDSSLYADGALIAIGVIFAIGLIGWGIIIGKLLKKREMIVTNKRVIVRSAFGFREDMPIEKITNVSTRFFSGIGCGTPSTKIKFHFCKNKVEVFDTIISESLQRDSKYGA